jgi:NAD(P)-dependent dehydrogenase (short-subunit alcohol dehydrogenase family)
VVKKKKVVLITGAASGLGKCIAEYLAERDYQVFGTDMNKDALQNINMNNINLVYMDVTDHASILNAYDEVQKRTERLDVLINNAGIFDQIPMVEGGPERYEQLINVNVLGGYRVTNIFFPLLHNAMGRIINLSSETARTLLPFQSYGSSKYMMEAWSNLLRMELKLVGMHVSLIRAGGHKTPFMDKTISVLDNVPEDSIFKNALNKIRRTGGKRVRSVSKDPRDVAQIVLKAITDDSPKRMYSVNESYLYRALSLIPRKLKEALVLRSLGDTGSLW